MNSPSIFSEDAHKFELVVSKSRYHSAADKKNIQLNLCELMRDGSTGTSISLEGTGFGKHKQRMVVDFVQTISRCTHLSAYPLPRMDCTVGKISQYSMYSK